MKKKYEAINYLAMCRDLLVGVCSFRKKDWLVINLSHHKWIHPLYFIKQQFDAGKCNHIER